MSAAELQQLIEQVQSLSLEERQQLQLAMDSLSPPTPEEALSRKLRELGLVRHPPRRRSVLARPRPEPIRVIGKPVSETLIEERR